MAYLVNKGLGDQNSKEVNSSAHEQDDQYLPDLIDLVDSEDRAQGFITVDDQENITYINNRLCQILGYERLELLGESFKILTNSSNFTKLQKFTEKRRKGRASSYQIVLKTKMGEQRIYSVSAAPLIMEDKFMGTLGIFSDITMQTSNLHNLRTSVQYHELMVKYLPLGLIILDSKGNIINMNPAFCSITGLKQENLLNKSVFKISFLDDIDYKYLIDHLLDYNRDFDEESREIELGNKKLFLRLRGFHLSLQNQRSFYLLVFGDITPRKKEQIQLQNKMLHLQAMENHLNDTIDRKEKELKEKEWQLLEQARQETNRALLAKISHFWRQPLNNASTLIQSLEDDYEFGELNEVSFHEKVHTAVNELMNLSKTLETFGYLSNDDVQKSDFNLIEVIKKILNLVRPSCDSAKITILSDCDHRIYTSGYPRRFGQVIVNIVENAMIALQKNHSLDPWIKVKLKFSSGKAVINILDNAGGIEADILTRIFDPYFTTSQDSQGLGLYMAKKVIEEMYAGKIEYIPTIEGSNFKISLPAQIIVQA